MRSASLGACESTEETPHLACEIFGEVRSEVFCCLGKDGGKSIQEEQVPCTGTGA